VFVANNSFALLANIKPFPGQYSQSRQERILNYRLPRAHRIMGNMSGILSARFCFFKPTSLSPAKVKIVTLTCIYSYNFLCRNATAWNAYSTLGTSDTAEAQNGTLAPGT
jgi:hypothetical protein